MSTLTALERSMLGRIATYTGNTDQPWRAGVNVRHDTPG